MRLIDADELLTAFPVDDEPTLTKSCVRMTIQHMPTIEPEHRWIPVTERIPGAGAFVLGSYQGRSTAVSYCDGRGDYLFDAWMPLPAPYKGEE